MRGKTLCLTGAAGSVITAVCCFTPLLVWLLPVLGLAGWLAWIDWVLLPALALFLIVTAAGAWRWKRAS